jgi:hypothetical protein
MKVSFKSKKYPANEVDFAKVKKFIENLCIKLNSSINNNENSFD